MGEIKKLIQKNIYNKIEPHWSEGCSGPNTKQNKALCFSAGGENHH